MNREAKGGPRTRYQGSSIEQACAKSEGFMFQTGSSMVQVKFQADVSGLVMQALSSRAEEDVDSPSGMLTAPWKLRSLMAVLNLTTTAHWQERCRVLTDTLPVELSSHTIRYLIRVRRATARLRESRLKYTQVKEKEVEVGDTHPSQRERRRGR